MTTIALAGRRIDAEDAPAERFPLSRRSEVGARLGAYLQQQGAGRLVCSAACGADLLALEAASAIGLMEMTIVLPFEAAIFRETSVIDRPGDWGPLYDRILQAAAREGRLITLGIERSDPRRYSAATERIIEEAAAGPAPVRACLVWDGTAHGAEDQTEALGAMARARGWPVDEIGTLR